MLQKLKRLLMSLVFIKPTNNLAPSPVRQKTREELRDLAFEMGFPEVPEK